MKLKNVVVMKTSKGDIGKYRVTPKERKVYSESWTTPDGLTLKAEVHDSLARFYRRIKILFRGKIVAAGYWSSYYEGMSTVEYGARTFILPTAYWEGALPIERVCEVIHFKKQGGDNSKRGNLKRGKTS